MIVRLALIMLLMPALASAAVWRLDPETRVAVDVGWNRQTVEVRFPTISGTVEFDETRLAAARAHIVVSTRDVETGVGLVNTLVRSRDYLNAESYPEIVFELDRLTRTSPQTADVTGRITMRGVTLPASFKANVFRFGPEADGFAAGFDITGAIDRTKFGSTGGLPDVGAVLPVRIRLVMSSKGD